MREERRQELERRDTRARAAALMEGFFAPEAEALTAEAVKRTTSHQLAERAIDLMGTPSLGALKFLFEEWPTAGAWIEYGKARPESRARMAADVEALTEAGMIRDEGGKWWLTERGARALALWALLDADEPATFMERAEAILFPEGLPTYEDLSERLEAIHDAAAELQQGPLAQVKAYEIECITHRRAPW